MAENGEGIKDRLTAKAGPLPVWGWAVLIIGATLIYLKYKKGKSSSDTTDQSEPTPTNTPDDFAAGLIGADNDLRNQLNTTNSEIAQLASNVNLDTVATKANTAELEEQEKPANPARGEHNYAVVGYSGHDYELGKLSGAGITQAELKKSGAHPEHGGHYVKFMSSYYQLGNAEPRHLTSAQYRQIKGHPKAVVVTPNTHVNVAPSKVR